MFFLFVSYYSLFFRNFPEVFANIQLSRNFSKISEFIITGFCPPIFPFFVMSLLFWSIFNNFTISLIYNACPEYANITLVYTHTYIIYIIFIYYMYYIVYFKQWLNAGVFLQFEGSDLGRTAQSHGEHKAPPGLGPSH